MTAHFELVDEIKSTSGEAQVAALRTLRNKLIGNDDEKLAHTKDDTIQVLLGIIDNEAECPASRIEASVLISSFSFGTYFSLALKHLVLTIRRLA